MSKTTFRRAGSVSLRNCGNDCRMFVRGVAESFIHIESRLLAFAESAEIINVKLRAPVYRRIYALYIWVTSDMCKTQVE